MKAERGMEAGLPSQGEGKGSISKFPSIDQEIPCWLVEGYIPEGLKTAIRLVIKSWFLTWGLDLSDAVLGLGVLFNTTVCELNIKEMVFIWRHWILGWFVM